MTIFSSVLYRISQPSFTFIIASYFKFASLLVLWFWVTIIFRRKMLWICRSLNVFFFVWWRVNVICLIIDWNRSEEEQAHTCNLILLCSLRCSVIEFCQQNTILSYLGNWNLFRRSSTIWIRQDYLFLR